VNFYLNGRRYSPHALLEASAEGQLPPFADAIVRFLGFWFSEYSFFKVSTSGSTSEPKEILLSRERIRASVRLTLDFFKPDSKTEGFVLCLPAAKVGGLMVLARALEANMDVLLLEPSLSPFKAKSPEAEEKKWLISMVPPQLESVLQSKEILEQSRNWKGVLLGGASVPQKLLLRIPRLKCPVYQSFGMTETVSHFALRKIWDPFQQLFTPDAPYIVLPGIEIRISPDYSLSVRGAVTEDQWIETHDLVKQAEGPRQSFFFLGRKDEVVNSGGLKIHPEEIRQSWNHFFSDLEKEPFFLGIEDDLLGEKLVMVWEDFSGQIKDIEKMMLEWAQHVDPVKLPRAVFFLSHIPATSTLKVNRSLLKSHLAGQTPVWQKK
jgi:O-succinylbenzoic acid--CoA ligase